jgi:hypothetical protein
MDAVLNKNSNIIKWNIDQDDIYCVLSIESTNIDPHFIISQLKESGYCCEELTW